MFWATVSDLLILRPPVRLGGKNGHAFQPFVGACTTWGSDHRADYNENIRRMKMVRVLPPLHTRVKVNDRWAFHGEALWLRRESQNREVWLSYNCWSSSRYLLVSSWNDQRNWGLTFPFPRFLISLSSSLAMMMLIGGKERIRKVDQYMTWLEKLTPAI